MEATSDKKVNVKECISKGLSKRVKRKIENIVTSENDCCPSVSKRANLTTDDQVQSKPTTISMHYNMSGYQNAAPSVYGLPQLPYVNPHALAALPIPPYLHTGPPVFHPPPALRPPPDLLSPVMSSFQPVAWNPCPPVSPVGVPVQAAGHAEAVGMSLDRSTAQPGNRCTLCQGKDELIDVQQNMICHLQHVVAVARNSLPAMRSIESSYMRISIRQGRIPRHIAERNGMFEIQIPARYQSGIFISSSFKYDLEVNHSERGTLIAKKLLQALFSEYDLAYAGDLLPLKGRPGIDPIVLAAIESFSASRGKTCADRPAIRCTLSAEITSACKARGMKGLKVFQRDRLLENPNNIPPTPAMDFVVSDIRQVLLSPSNSVAANFATL